MGLGIGAMPQQGSGTNPIAVLQAALGGLRPGIR
jgi:hypothetical protein